MTALVGVLLILTVAAVVAAPLLSSEDSTARAAGKNAERTELFEREKHVALLAIKEADFDLAMGKLSDDDYAALRGFYEERALGALGELDAMEDDGERLTDAGSPTQLQSFCTKCGTAFSPDDRFCGSCGAARRPGPS